jgi:LysM repeat protein
VAFLLAATLAVVLLRMALHDDGPAATKPPPAQAPAKARPKPKLYTVRAGDTLATIAATTGVSVARLHKLNPRVEPTSLFIGDRIRLR